MPKEINKSLPCLSKTKFLVGRFNKYIGSEVKNKPFVVKNKTKDPVG